MAITVADLLLSVAYRRGESASPTNATEQNRRIRFLSEAYRAVLQKNIYWFSEAVSSAQTVSDTEIYSLPTDYREMIEVRIDDLARYPMPNFEAFEYYRYPPLAFAYKYDYDNKFYYVYNNEIHFLPTPDSTPSSISVSSITASGTTATVTTATVHGLESNNYVVIAGATPTEYNGTKRIIVTSTTAFTYTVATGTSSPASGTITATKNNIQYRYFSWPTALTATTDTVVIPDQYSDCLVAYAFARLAHRDGERGDASDGFEEFNEIVREMNKENMRRGVWGKSVSSGDFKYTSR